MISRPHVLFVSYNGLSEPLGASQVLPYIEGLSTSFRFTVISFEKPQGPMALSPDAVRNTLKRIEATWIPLRYHSRGGLLAKAFDVSVGTRRVREVLKRDRPALMHARGYVPAEIIVRAGGGVMAPYIFDIRGLQAEESVEAGSWPIGGIRYRLTKRAEVVLLSRASGIVTLTHAIVPYVRDLPGMRGRDVPWSVIPCCADLDVFRHDAQGRLAIRAELGVAPETPVFVYIGSVGTWYSLRDSASIAARHGAFFLILTFGDAEFVRRECAAAGLPADRIAIRGVPRKDMAAHLSAADCALCLVKPSFSKRASSPTKIAEALACGIPVLTYPGIGDMDALARTDGPVRLVTDATGGIPNEVVRTEARELAEREFALEIGIARYHALYSRLIAA